MTGGQTARFPWKESGRTIADGAEHIQRVQRRSQTWR
jgi:hypothetical protein